jgi:hypothetical protein
VKQTFNAVLVDRTSLAQLTHRGACHGPNMRRAPGGEQQAQLYDLEMKAKGARGPQGDFNGFPPDHVIAEAL